MAGRVTKQYWNRLGTILASNAATLAVAVGDDAPHMQPLIGDFTEDTEQTLVSIDEFIPEQAFLAKKPATPGTQHESLEPGSGDIVVSLNPPVGGFRFESPSDFAGTVVITGYAITALHEGDAELWKIVRLPNAITINGPNQAFTLPVEAIRIPRTAI